MTAVDDSGKAARADGSRDAKDSTPTRTNQRQGRERLASHGKISDSGAVNGVARRRLLTMKRKRGKERERERLLA
ncbi:hypothetical protein Scep_021819 [Stephania cephalantha]|uniref:Uncharacterized protein n=1 Tax=Stephania cephalantha TaxID=152367 RepID=A0AAP0F6Q9_9MAGN